MQRYTSNIYSATDTYQLSPSSGSMIKDSQDMSNRNQNDDDDEPTDPFIQAGPSSPEILEVSSRYVEEDVSVSQSEEVFKPFIAPYQNQKQSISPILR